MQFPCINAGPQAIALDVTAPLAYEIKHAALDGVGHYYDDAIKVEQIP